MSNEKLAAFDPLTTQERAFVLSYATTGSIAQAARAAGFDGVKPSNKGRKLLTKPTVQRAIAAVRADAREHHKRIFNWVVREIASCAGANLADLLDERGNVRPPSDIEREVMGTVAEYSRTLQKDGSAETKVKQYDRLKALQMLSQLFGFGVQRHEVSVVDADGNPVCVKQAEAAIERAVFTAAEGDDESAE